MPKNKFEVDTFRDATSVETIQKNALFILSAKKKLDILEEPEDHPLIDEAFRIKFDNKYKKGIYKSSAREASELIIKSYDSIKKKSKLNEFEKKFLRNYEAAVKGGSKWNPDEQLDYLREQQQLLHMSEFFYSEYGFEKT